jgi:hypothetical protein
VGSHPHEPTIGTEEEKLGLVIKIYNVLFNARRPTRDEEIDDCLQRAVEYSGNDHLCQEFTSTYFSKQILGFALRLADNGC